jgi:hypothetical protein
MPNGSLLAGHAVYADPPLHPKLLRREASKIAYEGWLNVGPDPRKGEGLLRRSIELMVDAFLLDRRGNADLFVRAHQVGAAVEEQFSCYWTRNEERQLFENTCGILALHSRIGLSPGVRSWGRCSICDAGDFMCSHVPGRTYSGTRCRRLIYRWDPEELSWTARPRDPRCFRVWAPARLADVDTKQLACHHCRACYGRGGGRTDDINQSVWSAQDPDTLIEATAGVSRSAPSLPTIFV